MWFRIKNYFTALLILSGLALAYRSAVTPWLEPPEIASVPLAEMSFQQRDELVADLFDEGSWQRGVCKKLQTSDGILLFQNWEQIEADQWKLWPVTVVIGRGLSGNEQRTPIILDAPQGAEIKFTQSLDVMSGGAPPIHRGQMLGPVHIYRSRADDPKEVLDIQTANVGIDRRKIWTSQAIRMQVGQATMEGRDLTLHLAAQAIPGNPTSGANQNGIAVLDRMELIYLDQLVMPIENAQRVNPQSVAQANVSNAPATGLSDQAVVSVRCGGRVEYDFAMDELVMHQSVSLQHQIPGQPPDRFDCETLALILNDPTNKQSIRDSVMDWLTKIVATGSPAVAQLPSLDADLAADRIELDARAGLVRASGQRGVRVRRGPVTARLAKLTYQFNPQNPDTVEAIVSDGPGTVTIDNPDSPVRDARWTNRFEMHPSAPMRVGQANSDIDILVDGDVTAKLVDGGVFQADSIRGVFQSVANDTTGARQTFAPKQIQIVGHVRIDTTAIAAQTQRMDLFFRHDPASVNDVRDAEPQATSPLRQWVIQPNGDAPTSDPVARPRPTLIGDAIIAELNQNRSGIQVRDLTVKGNVKVIHELATGGQLLPAQLTGQRLRLQDLGGADVIQLESLDDTPARFDLGDGFFLGPRIQVRPADNTVWMNAAGEFQIPTAALPTGLTPGQQSRFQWTQPPHCRWNGEMIFDGHTAVLTDGVTLTASLSRGAANRSDPGETWDLHMTGDRLQVDLQDDVQVRDVNAIRGAAIDTVTLMQTPNRPLMVQAIKRAGDGARVSRHLIHARQLALDPANGGTLIGQGPGWYRGWFLGGGGGTWMESFAESAADGSSDSITGVHLIFADSMRAALASRKLDFIRGVRVGVRAVSHWEEAFDVSSMSDLALGQSTLDCDRLRFNLEPGSDQMPTNASTAWEMEAVSGVFFRTRTDRGLLEATANRASYTSRKDLFTIEGAPGQAAIFRQTLPDGSSGPEGQVRTMTIRPKTLKIENAVLERLNIGAMSQPDPRR